MQVLQKLKGSVLFAILFLFLTLGGLSTALAENQINQPTPTITKTRIPTRANNTADLSMPTFATLNLSPSATILPSPSSTAIISHPTICPNPSGWITYTVQINDTLDDLAEYYQILPSTLKEANCLIDNNLIPNTRIYLPPTPTATPTPCGVPDSWTSYTIQIGDTLEKLAARYEISSNTLKEANCLIDNILIPNTRIYIPPIPTATTILCGAPYSWVKYTVKAGDNLYRISLAYRTTVAQLQNANCLGYSTKIKVGQKLYVPNLPTSTPVITNTPTSSPTFTFTPDTP